MNILQGVPVFAAALWWGSLTTIGFMVVPTLFASLPTPALAGQTAARLFTIQSWVGLACGMLLLLASRGRGEGARMGWAQGALLFVLAGMLLAALLEFAVAPRILARENFKLWHRMGFGMYVLQWVCSGVTLWKLGAVRSHGPS